MLCILRFFVPPIIEGDRRQSGDFAEPLGLLISQRFHRGFEPCGIAPGTERARAPEEFGFAAGSGLNLAGSVSAEPNSYVGGVADVVSVSRAENIHVELGAAQLNVAGFLSRQVLGVVPGTPATAQVAVVTASVVAPDAPPAIGAGSEPGQVYATRPMAAVRPMLPHVSSLRRGNVSIRIYGIL